MELNAKGSNECLDLCVNDPHATHVDKHTLVGRILSEKTINLKTIRAVLASAWNLGKNVEFKAVDSNTIICQFLYEEDMEKIFETGPWAIKGATVNFQKWPEHLTLEELEFQLCAFWIQIHNLPPNRMNIENAQKIGAFIGRLLNVGDADHIHCARKFMRIQVLVDTSKPLKTGCFITREDMGKHWIAFKYERLSDFCYRCGRITHSETACPESPYSQEIKEDPNFMFGPWLRSLGRINITEGKTVPASKSHAQIQNLPGKENTVLIRVNEQDPNPQSTIMATKGKSMATPDTPTSRLPLTKIDNIPPRISLPTNPFEIQTLKTVQPNFSNQAQPLPLEIIQISNQPETDSPPRPEYNPLPKPIHIESSYLNTSTPSLSITPQPNTFSLLTSKSLSSPVHKRKMEADTTICKKLRTIITHEEVESALSKMQLDFGENQKEEEDWNKGIQEREETRLETVEVLCRRFIHIKKMARRRGNEHRALNASRENKIKSTPVITFVEAEEAGQYMPPTPP